jgi:hypothetical protein
MSLRNLSVHRSVLRLSADWLIWGAGKRARISGTLDLDAARLECPLLLDGCFLAGVRIGGRLGLDGARLQNPGGCAVELGARRARAVHPGPSTPPSSTRIASWWPLACGTPACGAKTVLTGIQVRPHGGL